MSLHAVCFALYFIGSCVASLRWPVLGALCYIVVYHVFPETTWWGGEIQWMGLRYSMTAAVATGLGFAINYRRHPIVGSYVTLFEVACLLFLVNLWVTPMWGMGWSVWTGLQLDKMTKVFIFVLMMTHIVVSMRNYRLLVLAFVVSAWYLGHRCHTAPRSAFHMGRLDGIGGPDFREATSLSLHLAATLPLVAVQFVRKELWMKALSFLAAAYTCQGIILAQGRSAFVGLSAGVAMAVLRSPKGWRGRIALVFILGSIGAYSLTDDAFWRRMTTILDPAEQRDASSQKRIEIWRMGVTIWEDYPLGIGIGNFEPTIGQYDRDLWFRDSHSTYIAALTELGIQGVVLLAVIVMLAFRELSRARTLTRGSPLERETNLQVYALRVSLVVFLFGSLTVTRLYAEAFWWMLAIPLCLRRSVEHELAQHPDAEDVPMLAANIADIDMPGFFYPDPLWSDAPPVVPNEDEVVFFPDNGPPCMGHYATDEPTDGDDRLVSAICETEGES